MPQPKISFSTFRQDSSGVCSEAENRATDLTKKEMPKIDRASIFNRMAQAGTLFTGLVVGTSAPATGSEPMVTAVRPPSMMAPVLPPLPAGIGTTMPRFSARGWMPPAPRVVDTTIADVTQMPGKPFVYGNSGGKIPALNAKSGLWRPGNAEAVRVIAEGIAKLKELNNGAIPADKDLVLSIKTGKGLVVRQLNQYVISAPDYITSRVLSSSMHDPVTRMAIQSLRDEVKLRVVHTGDTLALSYVGKSSEEPAEVKVELVDKPK